MLSVIYVQYRNEVHHAECRYAECRYAECSGAKYKDLSNLFENSLA
jgi:hypothetical protein